MANSQRDLAKEQSWRDVVRQYVRSGLTVREFCRRESLAEASFYAWRRTLAERDAVATMPIRASGRPKQPAFLPVIVSGGEQTSLAITIELAGGRVLRLPEGIPAERLAELIAALEARVAR